MSLLSLGLNSSTAALPPLGSAAQQRQLAAMDYAEQILTSPYGGNAQQKHQDNPTVSAKDYFQYTGRVDAGMGTGDIAQRDTQGNITGYKNRDRSLTGGTILTPENEWLQMFPEQKDATLPQTKATTALNLPKSSVPSSPFAASKPFIGTTFGGGAAGLLNTIADINGN